MKAAATKLDLFFRAFSDRTRLRILHLLREGDMCVGTLVEVLGAPQPTISRHLGYLRRAGLVAARKRGLFTFYRLAPARSAVHKKLVECLGCCFRDVPELAADVARAQRLRNCC